MATMTARRPPRLTAFLALALAAPLSGCTKAFDTASLDPLGDAGTFCRARFAAHYLMRGRCEGGDLTQGAIRTEYWTHAECDGLAASVAAGRMTYDRPSAEACLAAYQPPSCSDPGNRQGSPCVLAISPTVPEGGECARQAECLPPGTCRSPSGTCPGRCLGFAALGASCDALATCGPGLWCEAGQCAPSRGPGEPCDGNCREGLTCLAGFCSSVAGPGESCAALTCDGLLPIYCEASSALCLPLPQTGEACGTGGQCRSGLSCDAGTSRCFVLPTLPSPDGGSCATPLFCGPTSYCDTTVPQPVCRPAKPLGAQCAQADACLRPASCDTSGAPSTWVCRAPRTAGSPCGPGQCAPGLWCHVTSGATGVCRSEPDVGQPCGAIGVGDEAFCGRGTCVAPTPGAASATCVGERLLGQPCASSDDCFSNHCDPASSTCAEACP
jgi:hypothetical protein